MSVSAEGRVIEKRQGRRTVRYYEHDGRTLTAGGWSKEPDVAALGLSSNAIGERVKLGWTVAAALTTPKGGARPGAPSKPVPKRRGSKRSKKPAAPPSAAKAPAPKVEPDEDAPAAPRAVQGRVRAWLEEQIANAERELAAMRAALEAYDEARG